ncbi:MAG TPA: 5-formyltetrahydrofolate cyclo-ligase [Phycisphaerales bacterium]|nr:5-formyltetrahydrofolate cyclo-ligase [Phycisphaerales bacterium]
MPWTAKIGRSTGQTLMDKQTLRGRIKDRLEGLDSQVRAHKSRRVCEHVIAAPEYERAGVVLVYLPIPGEVDLSAAILHAWQHGKTVAAPKVDWRQRHMTPVEIQSLDVGFDQSVSGLRNPRGGVPVPPADIDMVLVPGLAFDQSGGRLGRGGGFYDRFLATTGLNAPAFGVAFGEQMVEAVPMDPHDRFMDGVVTDEQFIRCAEQGGPEHG